jgi:hypothetical protein
VQLFCEVGMFEDAVALALTSNRQLAIAIARRAEGNEALSRKLWLAIARHIIEQGTKPGGAEQVCRGCNFCGHYCRFAATGTCRCRQSQASAATGCGTSGLHKTTSAAACGSLPAPTLASEAHMCYCCRSIALAAGTLHCWPQQVRLAAYFPAGWRGRAHR